MSPRSARAAAAALLGALALLALGAGGPALAAGASATWAVEPAEAVIGEAMTLTLSVAHGHGEAAAVERLGRAWGPLEVMEQGRVEPEPAGEDGSMVSRQRLRVRAFVTGTLAIPPVEVHLVAVDGRSEPVEVEPAVVQVRGTLKSASELPKDIRGQAALAAPSPWTGRLSALAALVGLGLVATASRSLRRLRAPLPLAPPPPPDPGAGLREALRALDQIDALGLAQAGRHKTLYGLTNDVLRGYLAARWGVPAMDRTSAEILDWSMEAGWPEAARRELAASLREADLVKFARLSPAPERAAALTDALRATLRRWEGGAA